MSGTKKRKSCIYEGHVAHHRRAPVEHAFTFRFFWMYLDLAELPTLFGGRLLWSHGRRNLAAFHRQDYLGDPGKPLDEAVRDLVQGRTGSRPEGPIRVLTQLRYAGYIINPVTFYYCFDHQDTGVEAIVAEITNTPWGQRFSYVLSRDRASSAGSPMRFSFDKEFHVSPFMEMDQSYEWSFSEPAEDLQVRMNNLGKAGKVFDAALSLQRREITGGTLARMLVRYPLMTLQVVVAIYWQALRLWMRGAKFHGHPETHAAAVEVKE